jgi:hypothetical protein
VKEEENGLTRRERAERDGEEVGKARLKRREKKVKEVSSWKRCNFEVIRQLL